MCHLTKDTAVRAGDTLDSAVGTVDIPVLVVGQVSVDIAVAGCNLAVCHQLVDPLFRCYETSLSVGCRVGVNTAKLGACQPWGFVGHNLRVNHLGNMASDGVEGQSRCIRILSNDLAARYQSELDQCLETITDTKSQSITLVQKLHYCFLDLLILESSCEEFCRSIRLISCGESTREHDDLCITDSFFKCIHGFTDIISA